MIILMTTIPNINLTLTQITIIMTIMTITKTRRDDNDDNNHDENLHVQYSGRSNTN